MLKVGDKATIINTLSPNIGGLKNTKVRKSYEGKLVTVKEVYKVSDYIRYKTHETGNTQWSFWHLKKAQAERNEI